MSIGLIIGGVAYAVCGGAIGFAVHVFTNGDSRPTLRSLATASALGLLWPVTVVLGLWVLFTADFSK